MWDVKPRHRLQRPLSGSCRSRFSRKHQSLQTRGMGTLGAASSRRFWLLIAGGICIIGLSLALGLGFTSSSRVRVPALLGKSETAAKRIARDAGFAVRIVNLDRGPARPPRPGTVVAQSPAAGRTAPAGSVLALNVYRLPLLAQRLPAGAFSSCTPVPARCADCPTSPSGQPSSPVCSASAHAVIEKFALRQRILRFSAN